jgi:uncharacterized protein with HEPN domain
MRSDRLFLYDIVESIDRIDEFLAGLGAETFATDEKTKAAVLHKLTVIGEASRHLRDSLAPRYPEVDWSKAAALRNLIAHAYFSIDYEIVYRTARESLPRLRRQIAHILATEYPAS